MIFQKGRKTVNYSGTIRPKYLIMKREQNMAKGRTIFTKSEIANLKHLVNKKVISSKNEQKIIRNKIRSIGFYFSDFSNKSGYTVVDLDELICNGIIEIVDDHHVLCKSINETENMRGANHPDIDSLLECFKLNCFDPVHDNKLKIPDSPGNYILCLKRNSRLPVLDVEPVLSSFDDLKVIYTGIAGRSLRKRDYYQHFEGNNAGNSTLRKSLGVLFGYKQKARDKDPNTGKTKFCESDEKKLSEWMKNNLLMFFITTPWYNEIEQELINYFNPPLNLQNNRNVINIDFRKELSLLRSRR